MSSPKNLSERMTRFEDMWQHMRPHKRFGGMSLNDFRELKRPAKKAREEISAFEGKIDVLKMQRDYSDVLVGEAMHRIVCSVLGDPEEGDDGDFYEALGYTRRSMRRTGLVRRVGRKRDAKRARARGAVAVSSPTPAFAPTLDGAASSDATVDCGTDAAVSLAAKE